MDQEAEGLACTADLDPDSPTTTGRHTEQLSLSSACLGLWGAGQRAVEDGDQGNPWLGGSADSASMPGSEISSHSAALQHPTH